jgi:hypothetical protein
MSGPDPDEVLPAWWRRPKPLPDQLRTQLSLFSCPVDEALARAAVGREEARGWYLQGWLSVDVGAVSGFSEAEVEELLVVRDLAQSGLSSDQVGILLDRLGTPCRHDRTALAYSFAYGWVEAQPHIDAARHALMREHLGPWIQRLVDEGEKELLEYVREEVLGALASLHASSRGGSP